MLDSWDAYLRAVTDPPYANWAFRGQGDAAWSLSSTLTRYFRAYHIPQADWAGREDRALGIFKRKATHFLTHIPARDDDFEWMALMQHHGAPTRLLDFTWSPYVAAFFALERAADHAAVWGLNPQAMTSITPLSGPSFTLDQINSRIGVDKQVGYGEPYLLNRRLAAQSGTLVVPTRVGVPVEDILGRARGSLVKLVLPRDKVRELSMRELYRMKITHETLFPDLDGLARSLAYELEFKWWR
ncbi:MAG TPA: FRG domain-containing protein [Candidatus Acidoferrales bacterium]